ncbi:ABC transporter substrate-binding protein [Chloroflexota bacterium]
MNKLAILLVPLLGSVLILNSIACESGSEEATLSPLIEPSSTNNSEPQVILEPVEITIGNYSDKTGPAANAQITIDMALEDMVRYYNEDALIPGVTFKVINYDSQLDPSKDIPGYEWLKEHGADLIWTPVPSAPITLKPLVEKDRLALFPLVPDRETVDPPGYVFGAGSTLLEYHAYTLLKWLAENDPDFPDGRPAKIGGAGWSTGYMETVFEAAKAYAKSHPEQYDWEGGHITNFAFMWGPEVEALKDCDYIIPPTMMNQFVEQYRGSGYTGKFIGTTVHTAFFNLIDEADTWDEIDGMQIIMPNSWWNEESEVILLAKDLLNRYHPGQLEEMMRTSSGYLTVNAAYIILELIREAVNEVGPKNFSSQALYDAARGFTLEIDGRVTDSFNSNKRCSRDWFAIYEFDAEKRELVRLIPNEWLDVIQEP